MSLRQYLLVLSIMIITGTPISHAILRKRQMCVEYQIRNSRSNETILRVFYGLSEGGCLRQCARHPNCTAYNMRHADGTCELVSALGTCAETTEADGSKYVSLGGCNGEVPWKVGRRNWASDEPCLTWHLHYAYNYRGDCPSGTLTGPAGWACVALVPCNGLYLPGWCARRNAYRLITEQQQAGLCDGAGCILKVAAECPTTWQSYIVGDPVPPRAVNISTWKDGTPLYMVAGVPFPGKWYLGYLLPSVQRAFIYRQGVQSPTNVQILVYIWIMDVRNYGTNKSSHCTEK